MPYVYFAVIVPSFYYLSNRTDVQCSAVSHLWFLCFNHLILSSIKLKNNLLDVIFGFHMVTLQKNKSVFEYVTKYNYIWFLVSLS